ncbi:MAG TPA: methenyltetrahydromethanopterin cyclohydrolase [Archaeoglobus profundus]|nr:methenyltetrahydromethanopterin cyclohydrolase [Archaeoglobus profundus]HIP58072.1 methenyltetrahydromethanopterin cyclohydrolase [Archaeoglobus profundus]
MLSVNELALDVVEDMLDYEEELNIRSKRLYNGATIIDCGVNVKGGYDAGIMFVQVCMGGLAGVNIEIEEVNGIPLPFIWVYTDHPALACLGCQKAEWKIELNGFKAIASGPARALALKSKKTFELIDYEDDTDYAVIALESNQLPNAEVMEYIAKECGVDVKETYAVVAPTRSLVGSMQVSARVIEVALYRMVQLGYDPKLVRNAFGKAPIAPVMEDDLKAMGATNDSIVYYGSVILTVDKYEEILENLPSEKSELYGKFFAEIFKGDLHDVDPAIFAPAKVVINDVSTGKTYVYGKLNAEILLKSYNLI